MLNFITEYRKAGKNQTLQQYIDNGGFQALRKALTMTGQDVLDEVKKSGLRGRGGAYFPAGIRWQTVKDAAADEKYLICNADEGEPGTFKDRCMLETCCWQVLEGILIAAYATGVKKGYLYLRGEYRSIDLRGAVETLAAEGYLGEKILGADFTFNLEVRSGAGAYICGEESALIESIEGKRGLTRIKPPIPALAGLWGCPTLINNVETFATVTQIVKHGAEAFLGLGQESTSGSKLVCLSGCFKNKGVFEVPLGISLEDVIYQVGGGPAEGQEIKFLHIGGLTGCCIEPSAITGIRYDIDELKKHGLSVGTGAIYAASKDVDVLDYAISAFDFFREESCGRCFPCREGQQQICNELNVLKENGSEKALERIERIADTMKVCSACGLGQAAPVFLQSALNLYKKEEGKA